MGQVDKRLVEVGDTLVFLDGANVINIVQNSLNYVDTRLMDHGLRVAYMMYYTVSRFGKYNMRELRDICILAMLHDIGAYKTEEIDKMVVFETVDIQDHSVYGYLFIKYFSPLRDMADIILYHHCDCEIANRLENEEHRLLAQLIELIDRADIHALNGGNNEEFIEYVMENIGVKYSQRAIEAFIDSDIDINKMLDLYKKDPEFLSVFTTPLTSKENYDYIKMIVSAIDFRSRYTVIHTVAIVSAAGSIAKYLNMSDIEVMKLETAALLHDLGKIGISVDIIDSPGKLSDEDMNIMKTHVNKTISILKGNIAEDIVMMAINHHEKLNGSGYPRKIDSSELTIYDRIIAVADIFEALNSVRSYKPAYQKEKVAEILYEMAGKDLLDSNIVSVVVDNYDEVLNQIRRDSEPTLQVYNEMNTEYINLKKAIEY